MENKKQNDEQSDTQDGGLIYGFIFDGKGSARKASLDDIGTKIRGKEFLWLHLDLEHPNTKKWLKNESGIERVICESLLAEDTRPRIYSLKDSMLAVFRGINFNPGSVPDDMVSLRLWINNKQQIISLRRLPVIAMQDMVESVQKGKGPSSCGEFLNMTLRSLTSRIGESVSDIDDQIDSMEELENFTDHRNIRQELNNIRRAAIGIRRYIVPQREALSLISTEKYDWLTDNDRMRIRESSERTQRYVEDLDLIRERSTLIKEEITSRIADQMNRTIYMMSIVATIFLPLGLLTGLLGINVGGIPGSEWKWSFVVVCGILVGLAGLELWIFKRRDFL
ncbi:MAG: zinc transporter ZntB [Fibrobacteria bacterium]|nr:zinc transporter ZntB [Fibrobacteria bacterium]